MDILIVTPHYLPGGGPNAALYSMLSEELVCRGHSVTVITAVPHYPSGRVPPGYQRHGNKITTEKGVRVIRVGVPSIDRSKLGWRLFQLLCYQVGAIWIGLRQSYQVVLLSNPALSTGLPLAFLAVMRRKPAVFSIHDVYPHVGVALGVFRHRAVIATVGAMERFCLRHARYVRILSTSFIPGMQSLGVPTAKMRLIYDWVDTELIQPLPRENTFADEQGLLDKFVVLYAGNIGLSQGLEHVLAAAEHLADQRDIQFLLIGEGAGLAPLVAQASQLGLDNVRFLPYQPRARLPEVLATADISLVPLQRSIASASLPSKIFSILASGRPFIASVDEGSDTWNLVQSSQGGLCIPPEDSQGLAEAILQLKSDPTRRETLGQNGRRYALQHHSPAYAAEQFEQIFSLILNGR